MNKSYIGILKEDDILLPETKTEKALLKNADFVKGLHWGEPRFGHPEGKVIYHIKEVFKNIDQCASSPEQRQKLRLIALVHDTFKYKEDKGTGPRNWEKHHASLACDFVKSWTDDDEVIKVTKLHDEAYYAWRHSAIHKDQKASELRLNKLLNTVKDYKQLYYLFFICDTYTGDKNPAPVKWFEQKVPSIKAITIK